jgi:hypothetical protein
MPLHHHLDGNGRKGPLTEAEVSSMVALAVEVEKRLQNG